MTLHQAIPKKPFVRDAFKPILEELGLGAVKPFVDGLNYQVLLVMGEHGLGIVKLATEEEADDYECVILDHENTQRLSGIPRVVPVFEQYSGGFLKEEGAVGLVKPYIDGWIPGPENSEHYLEAQITLAQIHEQGIAGLVLEPGDLVLDEKGVWFFEFGSRCYFPTKMSAFYQAADQDQQDLARIFGVS